MVLAGDPLLDLALHNGPFAGLLVVILWGGFKKDPWWVFGWVYRDLLERHNIRGARIDRMYEIAERGTTAAQTLAQTTTLARGEQGERGLQGERGERGEGVGR